MEHTSFIWVCFNCIQQDKSLIQCEYQFKLLHCCSISSNDRLVVVFPGFKMHYFVTKLSEMLVLTFHLGEVLLHLAGAHFVVQGHLQHDHLHDQVN